MEIKLTRKYVHHQSQRGIEMFLEIDLTVQRWSRRLIEYVNVFEAWLDAALHSECRFAIEYP